MRVTPDQKAKGSAPAKDVSAAPPVTSEPSAATQEEGAKPVEVAVEITDIKASGLPAKVGFLSSVFYVRVKGGQVPQRTKTAKYNKGDEFVASWNDTVKLSGLESSKVEIEVYARRFFFSYKVIKKTESKESIADLLEHSETRNTEARLTGTTAVELELLEEGQAAGKLTFKIRKSPGGGANVENPPALRESPDLVPPESAPASPKQGS
ncbi:hypothetical protein HD554DRAFT_2036544 [Boletus coccyginus]|nr:hypothetical protein HD554DRAFT_2036544 [Boletus coccyginus]